MALSPGTRIGPYEITGAVGAGGMGEVYRARDTRLNRDAAIKVLPLEALAPLQATLRTLPPAAAAPCPSRPRKENPVGEEIPDQRPCLSLPGVESSERLAACADAAAPPARSEGQGSIIVVVATDAPLLPHQLKRIATRPSLGIARMGGRGDNSSGDIFVAFSTANPGAASSQANARVEMIPNASINPLFAATIQATEGAILNALLAAETMTGADGVRVTALPHDRLLAALRKYGRIQ